jgi:galacturonokinase
VEAVQCAPCLIISARAPRPPMCDRFDSTRGAEERRRRRQAFSGLRHALTSTPGYNLRVHECEAAAAALTASVLRASQGGDDAERETRGTGLSAVSDAQFRTHAAVLSATQLKRATHYYDECRRVEQGVAAWRAGDMTRFGEVMNQSGLSSIHNYECGCEALVQLRELLAATRGVLGARFSGAGFRGCCVALVEAGEAEAAAAAVTAQYAMLQPTLAPHARVLIVDSGAGARLL